ncbi:hypothetical protein FK85_00265 [Halorubrum saccharovorum]|uniref:Uncharacterized protein n=1 Tax=Halorubrum saccharovorum TaxID=2248 RepID=A0A081EW12_9EURY|nr:hypothetical protein [Halorubrum saccharovorum]KDS91600.1 hypothetical protein FK85_00265 [Halorubrum saccharovorum]
MTSLPNFVEDARNEVLDNLEEYAREEVAPEVQARAHGLLRAYGQEHDYDVKPIIEAGETEVVRRRDRVVVRFGWPEPAIYFERGTVEHVVEAKNADALSFVWEDPPEWVREEFEPEDDGYRVYLQKVEVAGLPESRFIRDTLNWLQAQFR